MITNAQYFGVKPHDGAQQRAAGEMLGKVNGLVDEACAAGAFIREIDPDTGTEISGTRGGAGDGGYRLKTASTGTSHSSHMVRWVQEEDGSWTEDTSRAKAAVDQYDPANRLDEWLDQFEYGDGQNTKLEEHGLFREHPEATPGWCHLTDREPRSGRRTFRP